jgi:hypothetical protein
MEANSIIPCNFSSVIKGTIRMLAGFLSPNIPDVMEA